MAARSKNSSPVAPLPVNAGMIFFDLTQRVRVDRSMWRISEAFAEPIRSGVVVFGMSQELHIAKTCASCN